MSLELLNLPGGGQVVKINVSHKLTHYDLVSAVIYAKRNGEDEVTRSSCVQYAKRLLRELGVEGLIAVYNNATPDERLRGREMVSMLFPAMTSPRPSLRLVV